MRQKKRGFIPRRTGAEKNWGREELGPRRTGAEKNWGMMLSGL